MNTVSRRAAARQSSDAVSAARPSRSSLGRVYRSNWKVEYGSAASTVATAAATITSAAILVVAAASAGTGA